MNPKISVIMSVYNSEKYVREAILSILGQTFRDFEFIIINDGSTDKSREIIENIKDDRIKIISRENKGLIYSLNEGIKLAKGEYIVRMDADDVCENNRLEEQLKAFEENPEIVLIGSFAKKIDENGVVIGDLNYPPLSWYNIRKYSLLHNPFIHSSVMFRKDLVNTVGYYNKKFKYVEDYEFWTRIINKYPCKNISQELIRYRIHTSQITNKNNLEMRVIGLKVRLLAFIRFIY
jgi:glycosyltransferase involved in cell wall biosynthesis